LFADAPKTTTWPEPDVGVIQSATLSYEKLGYGTPAWLKGEKDWKS